MNRPLFKYKSLHSFEYFIDIVLNKRLYGSKYLDLNDPFEAYILGSGIDKRIYEERSQARICSASQTPLNELMWAHYTDGHRGYCVEFVPNSKKWDIIKVEYKDTLEEISNNTPINEILKRKLKPWEYEQEVRCIRLVNSSERRSNYMPIKINKIYLGIKMSRTQKAFIKNLVNKIDNRIVVIDVTKEDLLNKK